MSGFTLLVISVLALGVASWFLMPRLWAGALIALGRRRAGLTSRTIEVDGIKWHYLRGGRGPALLLLHGFGADASSWILLAPILRPRFTLLIPDLPGFGESQSPEGLRFDIEEQVRRLRQFLDELDISSCMVAGNSMGGYLATALAAHDPARVRALWLLAPLGVRSIEPGQVLSAIDSGNSAYLQVRSVRQFRELFLPAMFSTRHWVPGPLLKSLAGSAMARVDEVPRMLAEARFGSEPLESIARRVRQPVLLQWGADDQVVNPAGLRVMSGAFEDARCSMTENCGHLPMLECPKKSARLFFDFLEQKKLA